MPLPTENPLKPVSPTAQLGALCFFLSTIEYLIPKPLPFIRLGLANLPLMLGIDLLPFKAYVVLIALKIVGQNLISGSLFSYLFLFSAAGSFSSALVMWTLRRGFGSQRVGFIGIGIAGALISNSAQLVLARLFVFGPTVDLIVPPFLASGIVSGLALGWFCAAFSLASTWYRERRR